MGLLKDLELKHLNWRWDPAERTVQWHRAEQRRLRERFAAHNGIPGLQVLQPSAMMDSDELRHRARELFLRDGFVCVDSVLEGWQLDALRAKATIVMDEIVERDQWGGAKGMWQYSFGGCSATGTMLHHPEWAALVDLPIVHLVVEAILGPGYRCYGADGDFNLPGSHYQPLHSDMGDARRPVLDAATGLPIGTARLGEPLRDGTVHGPAGTGFHDPTGRITCRDLPCPDVCVNFPLSALTPMNGPMRIIPQTQHSCTAIPSLQEEPAWMQTSTLCPLKAGAALFRDPRTW